MDQFDQAQEQEARFRNMSIDAIKRLAAQQRAAHSQRYDSAFSCLWCGEAIPEARRLAVPGCSLCVQCQATKERLPEGSND